MTPTHRLRYDGLLAGVDPPKLGAALTDGVGTAITFPAALKYAGTAAVPTIADPDYLPLVIDPDTDALEIIWLTAYIAGGTTGTIARGQEGTSGAAHIINAAVAHGPTVADVGVNDGAPASYAFVGGDISDAASWYGANVGVHILPTWTPTVSGDLVLVLGPFTADTDYSPGGNFDVYLWKGDVANVDYPDATAGSAGFLLDEVAEVYPDVAHLVDWTHVDAGQPYTLIVVDWNSAFSGHTIDLAGLLNSLAGFGGLTDRPPPYTGPEAADVAVLPDGRFARRFVLGGAGIHGSRAEGVSTATGLHSHAEGDGSVASAIDSHAEGNFATASGYASHAEGQGTVASAVFAHAEGTSTHATGFAAHAEGYSTFATSQGAHSEGVNTAAQDYGSHAGGYNAVAARPTEQAFGGGVIAGGSGHNYQESRLCLGGFAAAAGTCTLAVGFGGPGATTPSLPLTLNRVAVVRGVIVAESAGVRAAWKYEVVAVMGGSGSPTLVAAATITSISADGGAAGWTVAITAVTNGLHFAGTGSGSAATNWVATAEIVEM